MYHAESRIGLFGHLDRLKMKQRQDSTYDQAEDMLFVFENLGMFTISSVLVHNFKGISDESTRYKEVVSNIHLHIDLEENRESILDYARYISNYFGCYDLADFFRVHKENQVS